MQNFPVEQFSLEDDVSALSFHIHVHDGDGLLVDKPNYRFQFG